MSDQSAKPRVTVYLGREADNEFKIHSIHDFKDNPAAAAQFATLAVSSLEPGYSVRIHLDTPTAPTLKLS
jgi:hypothetical protein